MIETILHTRLLKMKYSERNDFPSTCTCLKTQLEFKIYMERSLNCFMYENSLPFLRERPRALMCIWQNAANYRNKNTARGVRKWECKINIRRKICLFKQRNRTWKRFFLLFMKISICQKTNKFSRKISWNIL